MPIGDKIFNLSPPIRPKAGVTDTPPRECRCVAKQPSGYADLVVKVEDWSVTAPHSASRTILPSNR
jgi:hypothetical protein